jgi:DNA-binding transcriptional ArsR family regulator
MNGRWREPGGEACRWGKRRIGEVLRAMRVAPCEIRVVLSAGRLVLLEAGLVPLVRRLVPTRMRLVLRRMRLVPRGRRLVPRGKRLVLLVKRLVLRTNGPDVSRRAGRALGIEWRLGRAEGLFIADVGGGGWVGGGQTATCRNGQSAKSRGTRGIRGLEGSLPHPLSLRRFVAPPLCRSVAASLRRFSPSPPRHLRRVTSPRRSG